MWQPEPESGLVGPSETPAPAPLLMSAGNYFGKGNHGVSVEAGEIDLERVDDMLFSFQGIMRDMAELNDALSAQLYVERTWCNSS